MSFERDCDPAVFVPGQALQCPWEVAVLLVGLRATASSEVPAPMSVQKKQEL